MRNFKRVINLGLVLFWLCLPFLALALQTENIEIGRSGVYDAKLNIQRDASGNMIFRDIPSGRWYTLGELIYGGTGVVSSGLGGTGQNSAAWTGVPRVQSGVWSLAPYLAVDDMGGINVGVGSTGGVLVNGVTALDNARNATLGNVVLGADTTGDRSLKLWSSAANHWLQLYTTSAWQFISTAGPLQVNGGANTAWYSGSGYNADFCVGGLFRVSNRSVTPYFTVDPVNAHTNVVLGDLQVAGVQVIDALRNVSGANVTASGTMSEGGTLLSAKYEPKITAGTTAQYLRGDKSPATLNTAAVPELTNLYYTDTRARAALSSTLTGLTYTAATGVLSATSGYFIPTTATDATHVVGPATATDHAVARFDGTTGKLIQNSGGVTISDTNDLTVSGAINANNGITGMGAVNMTGAISGGSLSCNSGTLACLTATVGGNANVTGSVAAGSLALTQPTIGNSVASLQSTASSGDNPKLDLKQAKTQTINAAALQVLSFTTQNDKAYMLDLKVLGRRTAGTGGANGDCSAFWVRALLKNIGGTCTIVGTPDKLSFESDLTTDVYINPIGAAVAVMVLGPASTTYSWCLEKFEISELGS